MFLSFDNRYCGNECRTTNVTVLKSYLWACLQSNRSAFPLRVLEITSAENSKYYAWLLRFTYLRIVVSCHPATGSFAIVNNETWFHGNLLRKNVPTANGIIKFVFSRSVIVDFWKFLGPHNCVTVNGYCSSHVIYYRKSDKRVV